MLASVTLKVPIARQALYRSAQLKAGLRFAARTISNDANRQDIRTLEDLTKLKSLEDVDPELIKRLIHERASELDTKNELEMLKGFEEEEKQLRQSPLKRFTRPLWIFLLMSSTVYLMCHYVWWRLEYEEKEREYSHQVQELETELNRQLAQNQLPNDQESSEKVNNAPWYKRWFN